MQNVASMEKATQVTFIPTRDEERVIDFDELWAVSERLIEKNREAFLVLAQ